MGASLEALHRNLVEGASPWELPRRIDASDTGDIGRSRGARTRITRTRISGTRITGMRIIRITTRSIRITRTTRTTRFRSARTRTSSPSSPTHAILAKHRKCYFPSRTIVES